MMQDEHIDVVLGFLDHVIFQLHLYPNAFFFFNGPFKKMCFKQPNMFIYHNIRSTCIVAGALNDF